MDLLDDDSENDSDYVPEEDVNHNEEDGAVVHSTIPEISHRRKRKAQELFDELLKEDTEYVHKVLGHAILPKSMMYEAPMKRTRRKIIKFLKKSEGSAEKIPFALPEEEEKSKEELKKEALEIVTQVKKKTKVEEKRRFAGQEIVVKKTVMQSAIDASELQQQISSKSSIDKALEALKGPKAITTMSKSSVDWENFKEKEGLEDELALAAKNGYLEKKDFLDRCDYRSFEKERDIRLNNIAKRG